MLRTPLMRRRRIVAGALALAIPTAIFATATSANAYAPTPGAAEIILEAGSLTGSAANALPSGWWGHETATHNKSTVFSLNLNGGSLASTLAKIGPDATSSNVYVAFVQSPSSTNVKPSVTAGETVGQAYQWFDASTFGGSLSGNTNQNDYVDAISTDASYNAWFNAGQPVYGFNNNLQAIDATAPGAPLSGSHAIGTSILNTWAAGTNIGLVYYVSDGTAANNEPTVKADSSGHAEAAYVPLTTVALPSDHSQDPATGFPSSYDTLRTSAGYIDAAAGDRTASSAVTSSLPSPQQPGVSVTFNTTVTDTDNGNAPVTTGSVSFYADSSSTPLGTVTPNASGVASLPVSSLSPGTHSITATYTGPTSGLHLGSSSAAAESYTIAANNTTTVLAVNPNSNIHQGDPVTLTANSFRTGDSTTAQIPGTVTYKGFLNGSSTPTTFASQVPTGTNNAQTVISFPAAGNWTLEADFTPTDTTNYQSSIATTSSAITVAPPANPTATGNIAADIPAGSLAISTPYSTTNPINVGTLTPNTDPTTGYTGSAAFSGISVVDTRAGDLPWTVSAQSSNLTGGADGLGVINAQNVGITGLLASATPTNGAITFTNVPADAAPGATVAGPAVEPNAAGSLGLAGLPAKTIAHTAHGVGSWTLGGLLTVLAPADTEAGHYTGTVTFTLLSQ